MFNYTQPGCKSAFFLDLTTETSNAPLVTILMKKTRWPFVHIYLTMLLRLGINQIKPIPKEDRNYGFWSYDYLRSFFWSYMWEVFEVLVSVMTIQICLWLILGCPWWIGMDWFAESKFESTLDMLQDALSMSILSKIMKKSGMIHWDKRSWWRIIGRCCLFIFFGTIVQPIITVSWVLNSCKELYPTNLLNFFTSSVNLYPVGFYFYFFANVLWILIMAVEDSKLFPKKKKQIRHLYFLIFLYLCWQSGINILWIFPTYLLTWFGATTFWLFLHFSDEITYEEEDMFLD